MNQTIQKGIAICFLLAIGTISNTQSAILDAYLEQAFAQNLEIENAQLEIALQVNQIEQASKLWSPSIDADATYLLAKGGRKINFPIGDLFNPTYATLNQLTGQSQFPTDLENVETQLTPNNFVDAQISLSKPLINSSIRYNEKIQRELLKMKEIDKDLVKEEITYQVKSAYFNYLKSLQGHEVIDENVELLNQILVFNRRLVQYDKATVEVISDVEYEIEQLRSQKALLEEQSDIAKSLFNLILNRPLTTEIMVDTSIMNTIRFDLPDLDLAINTAMEERHEFRQIKMGQEINQIDIERIQKEAQPTVGASLGVGIQTEDFQFDDGGPLYTGAVSMSVNLFDGGLRKKRIDEIRVKQDQLALSNRRLQQQIELEVSQSYFSLRSILSQLDAQNAAVRSATRSMDLTQTRYENDRALLIEVLQAQNRLTTSQINRILTKYNYLIKHAEFEKYIAAQ